MQFEFGEFGENITSSTYGESDFEAGLKLNKLGALGRETGL
jgi:hypothetical protein